MILRLLLNKAKTFKLSKLYVVKKYILSACFKVSIKYSIALYFLSYFRLF